MSYAIDHAAKERAAEAYATKRMNAQIDFINAVMKGDMRATATFAAPRMDYGIKPPRLRAQTVGDVLTDALDIAGGPDFVDALRLLVRAANGEATQAEAQQLFARLAILWVEMFVEPDDEE